MQIGRRSSGAHRRRSSSGARHPKRERPAVCSCGEACRVQLCRVLMCRTPGLLLPTNDFIRIAAAGGGLDLRNVALPVGGPDTKSQRPAEEASRSISTRWGRGPPRKPAGESDRGERPSGGRSEITSHVSPGRARGNLYGPRTTLPTAALGVYKARVFASCWVGRLGERHRLGRAADSYRPRSDV
jgi:hypothetical protein